MLAQRIKILRQTFSLNQVQFAEKIGVSKQSVSNWENDNIQPSVEMLVKISRLFQVSTDYLLGLDTQTYGKSRMLDVSGIEEEKIFHLQLLINDLKKEGDRL